MLTSFPLNAGGAEQFAENTVRCLDGWKFSFLIDFWSSVFGEKTQYLMQDKANTLKCKALKFVKGVIDVCYVCELLVAR